MVPAVRGRPGRDLQVSPRVQRRLLQQGGSGVQFLGLDSGLIPGAKLLLCWTLRHGRGDFAYRATVATGHSMELEGARFMPE